MTTHDKHDSEGPDGWDDPALERAVADLDILYAGVTQPPHQRAAVDRAVYQRLAAPPGSNAQARPIHAHLHAALPQTDARWSPGAQWPPRARRRRRGAILAGVLLVAILGVGGVYASGSLVDQTFPPVALRHSQSFNLSQGACGFTMTVTRAYLDGSRAIVGFTVSGPAGRTFINAQSLPFELPNEYLTLTTAQGTPLPLLQAVSDDVVGTTQAQTLQFDAGPVPRTTSAAPLRLEVPYIAMTEQSTGGAWTTSPCETYHPDSSVSMGGGSSGKPTRVVAVTGPFAFDLQMAPPLAVSPREADLHQVAQAGGEQMTLDRVVVTPTDTRVYLWREAGRSRFGEPPRLTVALGTNATPTTDDPFSRAASATYQGTLIPDPLQDTAAITGTPPHAYRDTTRNPAGDVEYNFLRAPSLYNYHGPWTLVVPTGRGAVTFQFTVGDTPIAMNTPSMGVSPIAGGARR